MLKEQGEAVWTSGAAGGGMGCSMKRTVLNAFLKNESQVDPYIRISDPKADIHIRKKEKFN